MTAGRPAVVVLDAMGVLYQDGDEVTRLLVPYLRSKGCAETPDVIRTVYRSCSRGEFGTDDLWTRLGVSGAASDTEYCRSHRLTPGVVVTLERLTEAGIRLACLTNDTAEWSRILRRRFGLDRHIHHWCVSAEVGVRKPDPRVYRALLDGLGAAPADTVFVDDRGPNLLPAREVGMRTILFSSDDTDHHPVPRGMARVHTMADLAETLLGPRSAASSAGAH